MSPNEILRSIVVTLVGVALLAIVQPWLYQNTFMTPTDVDVEVWVKERYLVAAVIVAIATITAQIAWYFRAVNYVGDNRGTAAMKIYWFFLLIAAFVVAFIAVGFATYFNNGSSEALLSLIAFFVIDVIVLYWLPTAMNTPVGYLMYVIPLSPWIRDLLPGDRDRR